MVDHISAADLSHAGLSQAKAQGGATGGVGEHFGVVEDISRCVTGCVL